MKNVSPKVWTSAVVTIVLGALVAALGEVTPGLLGFLGPWAPVAFAGITALGVGISGYVVTDPVRQAGEASLAVHASVAAAAPKNLPEPAPLPVPSLNIVVPAPADVPEPVAPVVPAPSVAPPVPAADAAAVYDPLA